jgi:hypothetical protein
MRNIGSFTIDNQAGYWENQRASLQRALEEEEKAAAEDEDGGSLRKARYPPL